MMAAKVPEPVKKCEHTARQQRTCTHNWVARFRDPTGRQREKSFPSDMKEACRQFLLEQVKAKLDGTWVDPANGRRLFGEILDQWVESRKAASTVATYRSNAKLHVKPVLGNLTLAAVGSATGRQLVEELLTVTLPAKGLSASVIRGCYNMICAVMNDARRRGWVPQPQIYGISLPEVAHRAEIIWIAHNDLAALVAAVPQEYRLSIWLMRGAGLRLGEALGVSQGCLRDGNTILRVSEQMMAKGRCYGPLKHRKPGQFRDVPVADWLADMILAQPVVDEAGHLFTPIVHQTFSKWFIKARSMAGVAGKFTPHHLRHIFASVCLERNIPITDVSKWLGHKDINITFAIYGHVTPNALSRARLVLGEEYTEWKNGTPKAA